MNADARVTSIYNTNADARTVAREYNNYADARVTAGDITNADMEVTAKYNTNLMQQ